MGYRSQVALAIEKELCETKCSKIREDLEDCDTISKTKGYYVFTWDGVKWYEDYDDIKRITDFIAENNEKVYFVRIGEDTDDIEHTGCLDADIVIKREIDIVSNDLKETTLEEIFKPNSIKFLEKEVLSKKKRTKK